MPSRRFVADVAARAQAPPLTPRDLAGTPLATSVAGLLLERDGHATALVSLTGLADPAAVAARARRPRRATAGPEAGVGIAGGRLPRPRAVGAGAGGACCWSATVWLALRAAAPGAARAGADGADHAADPGGAARRGRGTQPVPPRRADPRRRAWGWTTRCSSTTPATTATSSCARCTRSSCAASPPCWCSACWRCRRIPVLRAIGSTVALGVASNFVLALLIVRRDSARRRRRHDRLEHRVPRDHGRATREAIARWCRTRARCACGTSGGVGRAPHRTCRPQPPRCRRTRCAARGRLHAVHLCEYGAQAMAVHGGLRATPAAAPGARACWWRCAAWPCIATASTTCRRAGMRGRGAGGGDAGWQYAFVACAACRGRRDVRR